MNRCSCKSTALSGSEMRKGKEDSMRSLARSFWLKCLVSALSLAAWAFVANAQNKQTWANAKVQNKQDMVGDREAAAESIVAREEAATGRAFDPGFRAEALRKLASLTPSELQSIQSQSGAGLGIVPKDFGSSQADLVFTPVTPCRIIDTRVAGGPIAAGSQRNFFATGIGFSSQGGFNGDCGVPFGPATAVQVNLIAVNPAGPGDLRAFPFGATVPLASVLNYANVQDSRGIGSLYIANDILVKICDLSVSSCSFDFTVQADTNNTDLVGDVMGYFKLLPSTLASGKTLKGVWGQGGNGVAGQIVVSTFGFPIGLPSAPTPNFIAQGGAPTTACPGSPTNPTATPGNLCVYEASGQNRAFVCIGSASLVTSCGTDPFGAGVVVTASATGQFYSFGTWAVTAP